MSNLIYVVELVEVNDLSEDYPYNDYRYGYYKYEDAEKAFENLIQDGKRDFNFAFDDYDEIKKGYTEISANRYYKLKKDNHSNDNVEVYFTVNLYLINID